MITGEYLVLDGALSLAIPTIYGQSLTIRPIPQKKLIWKSLDEKGKVWFEETYDIQSLREGSKPNKVGDEQGTGPSLADNRVSETLRQILRKAIEINPVFLGEDQGYEVDTALNFPKDWGLGSSSTLINNIAQWAKIDAYALLWNSFSGSGYDIACAQNNSPITYQLKNKRPLVHPVSFYPPFKNDLYFVHLNKKQNSREGIAHYKAKEADTHILVPQINSITQRILSSTKLPQFEKSINKHEAILSEILGIPTVKQRLFPDFKGAIKSLGAWGGDFVLATGNRNTISYFMEKGYNTVIPYSRMAK